MSKISKQLLETSMKDIQASYLLFDGKLYSQSFFYFQQATEKAFKAFGIACEAITENEIEEIRHNPLKIYRIIVEKQELDVNQTIEKFNGNEKLLKSELYKSFKVEEYKNLLEQEKQLLNKYGNIELFNIEHDDVIDILEHLEEVEESKFTLPKNYKALLRTGFTEYAGMLEPFNPIAAKDIRDCVTKDDELELLAKFIVIYWRRLFDLIFISKVLYFSTVVTMRHHVHISRYPKDGVHPLEFYTKKLPMIKFLSDYLRLLERANKKMKKICFDPPSPSPK